MNNVAKSFDILIINALRVLQNYFQIYLVKFLDISAKPFFPWMYRVCAQLFF